MNFYELVTISKLKKKSKNEILRKHDNFTYLIKEFRHIQNGKTYEIKYSEDSEELYDEISKYTGLSCDDVSFVMNEIYDNIIKKGYLSKQRVNIKKDKFNAFYFFEFYTVDELIDIYELSILELIEE